MTTVPLPAPIDAVAVALMEDAGMTTGVTMVDDEMPETVPAGGKEVVAIMEELVLLLVLTFRLEDEATPLTFDDEDATGAAPTDVLGALR